MITYVSGSLFESPAQVLVNTVNTEGVMGKGIALKFKKIYPTMFVEYQRLCERGEINIGVLWIYKTPHKWILNFPTKRSWRQPSQIEYIKKGLQKLKKEFVELNIESIAFPALGCGNGELDWQDVKPVMEEYLNDLPANIFIHPPHAEEEFPEHRNQKEIIDWLRSEPRTLAFSEVWRDLKNVLSEKQSYETGEQAFTASLEENILGRSLVITTNTRPVRIDYDELREVWSVLRTTGYLRRGSVTTTAEKKLSYIMPVLAELPYVNRVTLSERSGRRPYSALQYIASKESSPQLSLFR